MITIKKFFLGEAEVNIDSRKFLIEKIQEKYHLPVYLFFALGLLYLYLIEGIIANFYFHTPINISNLAIAFVWTLLWIFTICGMFIIRKKAFFAIDEIMINGYYSKDIGEKLKNNLLNFKVKNKTFRWKTIIYIILTLMLFIGAIHTIILAFKSPYVHWLIDTGSNYGYVSLMNVFVIYVLTHWIIAIFLTILVFDIVVITFSIGPLTARILEHVKGKIDFYNPDGSGGLKSLGKFMVPGILFYFISLGIFSVLLGIYYDMIYYSFLLIAWIIGIYLIYLLQSMVRKIIKENKIKRIKEISDRIKMIETEECNSFENKINKNSELSYLSNLHYLIKETDEYIIEWKIFFVTLFPILMTLYSFFS